MALPSLGGFFLFSAFIHCSLSSLYQESFAYVLALSLGVALALPQPPAQPSGDSNLFKIRASLSYVQWCCFTLYLQLVGEPVALLLFLMMMVVRQLRVSSEWMRNGQPQEAGARNKIEQGWGCILWRLNAFTTGSHLMCHISRAPVHSRKYQCLLHKGKKKNSCPLPPQLVPMRESNSSF